MLLRYDITAWKFFALHMNRLSGALKNNALTEPVVFPNVLEGLDLEGIAPLMSVAGLESIKSEDMVGVNLSNHSNESIGLPFQEAIRRIRLEGGYITGWEYQAGDQGLRFSKTTYELDNLINRRSWLRQLAMSGVPMTLDLDLVMKWVFISYGRGLDSTWHVDPLGSCAWMLMLVGEKKWTVKRRDGTTWEHILVPGQLLVLPAGLQHKVVNIGGGLNVAISHNWVDTNDQSHLWEVLNAGICKLVQFADSNSGLDFYDLLELFREQCIVDNLLFGLIMIILHTRDDFLDLMLPTESSYSSMRHWVSLLRKKKSQSN